MGFDAKFWRDWGKRKSPEQKLQEAGELWIPATPEESGKTRPMLDWPHMDVSLQLSSTSSTGHPEPTVRPWTMAQLTPTGVTHTWATFTNPLPDAPTTAPRKELPKELIAGPLIAYRTWKLCCGTGRLQSTGVDHEWRYEHPQAARCQSPWRPHNPQETIPASGCDCGWYALKEVTEAEKRDNDLLGTVALWGKVIAHTKGYRAQYAWPVRVTYKVPMPGFPLARNIRKELETIAANYGCEVFLGDESL